MMNQLEYDKFITAEIAIDALIELVDDGNIPMLTTTFDELQKLSSEMFQERAIYDKKRFKK